MANPATPSLDGDAERKRNKRSRETVEEELTMWFALYARCLDSATTRQMTHLNDLRDQWAERLDRALRNIAVLDNPAVPHTRDPDTDAVHFTDFEDWVWFKLKYL